VTGNESYVAYFGFVDTIRLDLQSNPLNAKVILAGGREYSKCYPTAQIEAQIQDKCTNFIYWTNKKN
jgi:hypothetical protein